MPIDPRDAPDVLTAGLVSLVDREAWKRVSQWGRVPW